MLAHIIVHLLPFIKHQDQDFNNLCIFSIHGPRVSISAGDSGPASKDSLQYYLAIFKWE